METVLYQTTKTHPGKAIWAGRIISVLCILFFLVDAVMKVIMNSYYVQASVQLGLPANTVQPIGIALLLSTIVYMIPRTAIIGAILLSGYLGGAMATMVRIDQPAYFPLIFAILVWVGICLRNEKLRAVILSGGN
jgi:DoxX-like family